MRLSEVKGERSADVVADVIAFVCALGSEEEVNALLAPRKGKKANNTEFARSFYPLVFKKYKKELYEALGSIEGCGAKAYAAKTNPATLFNDFAGLLSDPMFQELFPSRTPTAGSTSEPGSGNTGAAEA